MRTHTSAGLSLQLVVEVTRDWAGDSGCPMSQATEVTWAHNVSDGRLRTGRQMDEPTGCNYAAEPWRVVGLIVSPFDHNSLGHVRKLQQPLSEN
jgi:hypothetical protein